MKTAPVSSPSTSNVSQTFENRCSRTVVPSAPPSTAPDHSSPHSPSPSANNNLPSPFVSKKHFFSPLRKSIHSEAFSRILSIPQNLQILHNMFPELFCSHKSITKNSGNIFFILSPNFAPVNKLTPICPPDNIQPILPPSNTLSPSTHNNFTPNCPPGRSSPSSRPPTPGSGSASWHLPRRRAHWHHPPADATAPVCAAGATAPEPDPSLPPPHTNRAADPSSATPHIIL